MPAPQLHEIIDLNVFGKAYPEVHKWIDGAYDGHNGRVHWVNRHYVMAILDHFNPRDYPDKEKRNRLQRVAKLHVMYDWAFYYKRIYLPLSREDVVRELGSEGIFVV